MSKEELSEVRLRAEWGKSALRESINCMYWNIIRRIARAICSV